MAVEAPPQTITVTFVDEGREIKTFTGVNLRTLALNAGVSLYNVHVGPMHGAVANCRGFGLCGTCIVEVVEGMQNLVPETPNGLETFSIGKSPMGNFRAKHWHLDETNRGKYRLACQVKVMGDVKLKTVHDTIDFKFDD